MLGTTCKVNDLHVNSTISIYKLLLCTETYKVTDSTELTHMLCHKGENDFQTAMR